MNGVKKFLDNIEKYIIYVIMTVLVALMFTQVVARYVFSIAWGWAECLSRLLFVWVTFAGMSYACKGSEHLRVSFVAEFAPGKYSRTVLFLIGDVLLTGVCGYLCYLIFQMMMKVIASGQTYSGAPWLPVWILYLSGVLGMGGMAIRTIQYGIIPNIVHFKERAKEKPAKAKAEGSAE